MGLFLSVYGVTIRDTKKIKIVQKGGLDIYFQLEMSENSHDYRLNV